MSELGKLFNDVSRFHGSEVHRATMRLGIGRGMPPVLHYIIDHDGCRQSELSKIGHTAAATVTVMLQSMEKNGFIIRLPDKDDQRCTRIYITPKGRDIHRLGAETCKKEDEKFFSCLTEEERESLRRILEKLMTCCIKENRKERED